MNLYIAVIRNDQRRAVFAVHAQDETEATKKVLSRNTGWELERLVPKVSPCVFRIYDDAWHDGERVALPAEPSGAMLGLIAREYLDRPAMTRDQARTVYYALRALCTEHRAPIEIPRGSHEEHRRDGQDDSRRAAGV